MKTMANDHCANHPRRAAVERCEVCGKSLCNFCLYYTDEGQRLCEEHARQAASQGLGFNPPETYGEGLLSAQARAREETRTAEDTPFATQNKGVLSGPLVLYRANNNDLMGFIGMFSSFLGALALCGGGVCIPFLGVILSITALVNAGDAVDKKRTRTQGIIGLLISGAIMLLMVGAIAFCVWSVNMNSGVVNNFQPTTPIPSITPGPTRTRAPIQTPTPSPNANNGQPLLFAIEEPLHTATEPGLRPGQLGR